MQVLNFCILYGKYYIYIQCLFNNNTEPLYLLEPTQASLENEDIICNYVSNTMYTLPKMKKVFKIPKHKKEKDIP